jgi:hypothetical protein
MDDNVLQVALDTRWAGEESIRPFMIEGVMKGARKTNHLAMKNAHGLDDRVRDLHEKSTCDSPLWLQCCAALSVGPMAFGRFLQERAQYTLDWHGLFRVFVKEVLEKINRSRVLFYVTGPRSEHVQQVFEDLDPETAYYLWADEKEDEES